MGLAGRIDGTGTVTINDDESINLNWVDPQNLPDNTAKTHRGMIEDYLNAR